MRKSAVALVMVLFAGSSYAQFSGYASAGYGFHSNPLYNFATTSDQLLQGYWQFDYLSSTPAADWKIGYVGGLMQFQDLAGRNYYEHRMSAGSTQRFPDASGETDEEGDEVPFKGNTLEWGAKLGARHDRAEYRQFENWGGEVSGTFTWGAGTAASVALGDETSLRRYANVPELDNLSSVGSIRLTLGAAPGVRFSLFGGAGIKHYITSEVDTSVFITVSSSSSSNGKGQGRGKGKSLLAGTGNGKKDILVNASTVNTVQLYVGMAATREWEGGSAQGELLFRIDPGSSTRVLAQYTNSTLLTGDLYNDFFSHSGPEFKLMFHQQLAQGFSVSFDAVAQRRKYLSPAFDLEGVQTASTRIDVLGGMEVSLSRYIALGENIGFDVTLAGGVSRNESNDAYNDYSTRHYGLAVGVGF